MRLPGVAKVFISQEKICDYLLSLSHPVGGPKARFFRGFGFVPEKWEALAESLKAICENYEVKESSETPFGKRFVIDGVLTTPDKRNPMIRTVWFIHNGESHSHFVTAFPLPALKEVSNGKRT